IGVLHLPGEGLLQTTAQAPRAIDIPDMARHEHRGKEGEALDVVPVRMRNKQVPVARAWSLRQESLAHPIRPAAAVEDDYGPPVCSHLESLSIHAVAHD